MSKLSDWIQPVVYLGLHPVYRTWFNATIRNHQIIFPNITGKTHWFFMPVEHVSPRFFIAFSFQNHFLYPESAVGSNLSPNSVLSRNTFVFLGFLIFMEFFLSFI